MASLSFQQTLTLLKNRAQQARIIQQTGRVVESRGLIIESLGPDVALGDLVYLQARRGVAPIPAEVVGFREHRILLMPLQETHQVHPGSPVSLAGAYTGVPTGKELVGRIIDGFGHPIDGQGPLPCSEWVPLHQNAPCAMSRAPIATPLATGIKAIDTFTPLGVGQRMGIFSGSGVGKSTLLGMIARGAQADLNVIALIGERGRELREFIEQELGPQGLEKSVVVVSTSDQMAPLRIRAAQVATRIAESFRDQGHRVLLLMDSVTRLAMAQREIGLAIGEPPTTRGYTPSVFSLLAKLLERTGANEKGSITALYTVLVEGDQMNETITDVVRGILDGHLVLDRQLANQHHYPALRVTQSVSRLARQLCSPEQLAHMGQARELLALYEENKDLITLGAYSKETQPRLHQAVEAYPRLKQFLQQGVEELCGADSSWQGLAEALSG